MDQHHQSPWRPTRGQLLWTVAALALLTIAILIGYRYHITLWDWIKLLVVPVVIAGGGIWFNRQQRERELKIGDQRAEEDRRIAQERTKTDREIADQRAQDEALQAYLDQMGQLLLDKVMPLRQSNEGDEVRTLARARTLTVLRRLDSERKGTILRFLYDSYLITKDRRILNLSWANLTMADLSVANLKEANLKEANLSGADLNGANLSGADLSWAKLNGADLRGTYLNGANLFGANLSEANLKGADLREANMKEANMKEANMKEANLDRAVGWTDEQLSAAIYIEDATMPNGLKYEDGRKSTGHEGDGENSGPS